MINFLPNKTVALTMKDDYNLRDFITPLLNSGYTVSQSESTKDGYVQIHISYSTLKRTEVEIEEIC